MSARQTNGHSPVPAPANGNGADAGAASNLQRWHRIQTVRRQQGMSLRTVARRLGSNIRSLRAQEDEAADLRLSDLYRWQAALDVPLEELLVECERPLSRPVLERAKMVRVMKTATAIAESAPNSQIARLGRRLVEQLVGLMPELKDVSPWNSVGQRRTADELGQVFWRRISEACFDAANSDCDE